MYGTNRVIISGTLGRDPQLNQTITTNDDVTTISVATNEVWRDRTGQRHEHTEWHNVVLWGQRAVNASKYLRKGSRVYIEGKIRSRQWEDQDGHVNYMKEIVADKVDYLDRGPARTEESDD
jgi:single-strand DNA-binding protein